MSEINSRLAGMLGFAMRAGKLILGTDIVCRAMPKRGGGRVLLVAVSCTASDATKKKLFTKSEFYGIKATEIAVSTDELGRLLGKSHPTAAVGVTDEGFAKEILKAASLKISGKEVSDNGNGD